MPHAGAAGKKTFYRVPKLISGVGEPRQESSRPAKKHDASYRTGDASIREFEPD